MRSLLVGAVLCAAGCGGGRVAVVVTASPSQLTLKPGETQVLTGAIRSDCWGGCELHDTIDWSIREGALGGVVARQPGQLWLHATYTAPNTPGIYHVVLTDKVSGTVQDVVTSEVVVTVGGAAKP